MAKWSPIDENALNISQLSTKHPLRWTQKGNGIKEK